MKRTAIYLIVALIAAGGVAVKAPAQSKPFVDPARPTMLDASGPAALVEDRGTVFHSAPKPLAKDAITSDFPCLLGPSHNCFSPETRLLQTFPPAGPAMVWEFRRGEGYSQPVVGQGRVIIFHRPDVNEQIDCLDALTGKIVWRNAYPSHYVDRYGYCNGPRAAPVIAGDSVFTIGAEGILTCTNLANGKTRWRRNLLEEFHLKQNFFGVGASPLVDANRLIVNVGAPGGPCVAAFDPATGKMLWGAGDQWGPSYASPVPADIHGKHRVLVFAGGESRPPTGGLMCIDPSNGKVDFSFPWRGARRESVNASSPVVIGNQVFISECYGSGGVMLSIDDAFTAKPIWENPTFGTHFMTAIAKDGYLYGVDGHGPEDAFLCCVDLKTGHEMWRKQPEWEQTQTLRDGTQRKLVLGTYRCNLLVVDGRCLCLGEYGHLLWLDLNPKGYHELARAWLFPAGETWTPPVVSNGLLYVCQNTRGSDGEPTRLICYDLRAASN